MRRSDDDGRSFRGRNLVPCDACSNDVTRISHACLFMRYDPNELLVEALIAHHGCAAGRRPDVAERIEIIAATDIAASANLREKLRSLARSHEGGSISRVLRKIARIGFRESRRPLAL